MERLRGFWNSLDAPRRGLVALALVAFLAVLVGFGNVVSRPDMALLYGGMDPSEAARVLTALDQRGVRHDVRGQSIYVERGARDTLRMELAGEGIPSASGAGYELLDTLSGFGTTSQMFDAAYWRAKEGELARTILASPMITDARVHIATAGSSPFRRDSLTTASVAIAGAGPVGPDTARALQFLVAAAVADLSPENVSVIDSRTGRVLAPRDELETAGHANDREQALQTRVTRMLEAHVGPGNARVEVSIERELRRETVTERQIDPESRVVISQDTEEVSSQASGGPASVTVASNLPSGDAAADGNGSQEQRSETRERANFDVSELRRETVVAPGAIRRLSVAVLVNNTTATGDAAAPRSPEELEALRDLVAAAVGFDDARGDVLTLKALDFTGTPERGSGPIGGGLVNAGLDLWRVIQLGVLALVTIVLGVFVVRPLLLAQATAPSLGSVDGALTMLPAEDGAAMQDEGAGGFVDQGGLPPGPGGLAPLAMIAEPPDSFGALPDASPVDRLKSAIETRQPDTLEILRSWMEPGVEDAEQV